MRQPRVKNVEEVKEVVEDPFYLKSKSKRKRLRNMINTSDYKTPEKTTVK